MPDIIHATFSDRESAQRAQLQLLECGVGNDDVVVTEKVASHEVHAHDEVDYDTVSGLLDGAAVGLFVAALEGLGLLFSPGATWTVVGAGAATFVTGAVAGAAAGSRRQAVAHRTVAPAFGATSAREFDLAVTLNSDGVDRKAAEEILGGCGASDIRA